jgi:hypothetical protein
MSDACGTNQRSLAPEGALRSTTLPNEVSGGKEIA